MCGVKTNVITAVEIHGQDAGDCVQLPSLLASTSQTFAIRELAAAILIERGIYAKR